MSRFIKNAYVMATTKSALFVPANQERFIKNCTKVQPSLYLLDMEDSVPITQKDNARKMCYSAILSINKIMPDVPLYARPNELRSGLFQKDMEAVLNKNTSYILKGFSVPKIEGVEDMDDVSEYLLNRERELGVPDFTYKVIPWIESALAIANLKEILSAHRNRIEAAAFGGDDYCTDLRIRRTTEEKEMDFPRKMFALYCNAMQVVPMDTPYLYYKNPDGLKTELAMLRQFGFKGKFAIHPSQVSIINDAFRPLKEEIDYSKALVEEFNKAMLEGKAAINFRGTMVDIAAYKRALNIVKEATIKQ